MSSLNPAKLFVTDNIREESHKNFIPRRYTLTHSDKTGELFLTIDRNYNKKQISTLYIRFMRDEVLAEWKKVNNMFELHIHTHISGGFIFGWARLRNNIIRHHLPLVFQTLRYSDEELFKKNKYLDEARFIVHFHSKKKKYNKIEDFGFIKQYKIDVDIEK
jgi:hypothetical protein